MDARKNTDGNLHAFANNKKLAKTWANMKSRCYNKNDSKYKYYGGKKVRVIMEKTDLLYLWNRDKGSLMKCASIDRIVVPGDYTRENCRFIEMSENRRGHGVCNHLVCTRCDYKWDSLRRGDWLPKNCANHSCGSPYWNVP